MSVGVRSRSAIDLTHRVTAWITKEEFDGHVVWNRSGGGVDRDFSGGLEKGLWFARPIAEAAARGLIIEK